MVVVYNVRMGNDTQESDSLGIRRTIWLLGFLALIAIGWGILIVRVPILLQGPFPSFFLDRDSGIARLSLSNQNLLKPWSQEISFDLNSGSCDWKMSREIDGTFFQDATDRGNSKYRVLFVGDGTYRLVSLHEPAIADREFQFPHFPYLINGRFGIAESFITGGGNLSVMDFADEGSEPKISKVAGVPIVGGLKPIDGVDGFLRVSFLASGNLKPTMRRVQYFSIGSDLVVKPGPVWQVLILGTIPSQSAAICNDEIVSISATNCEVEFRDAADGRLIDTMPLLDGMDPVTMPCSFWKNFLRIEPTEGPPRFLDLKRRKWLPPIDGNNFGPNHVLGDKYILFRGRGGGWTMSSKIYDLEREVVISEFDSHSFTDFIDEKSILDVSFFSGLTFQKIDLNTGEVLQTWKPFWWVIPITSLLCVAWLIWSWAWLSGSGQNGAIKIWIDVAIVTLLPLVLCIARLKFIGNIEDLSRIPTRIAQAIIVSLLLGGVAWLVHSRTRIVPRILPFLMAMTVLAAAVTITFDGQLAYVVPGAIQAVVPVAVFLVCFLCLRKFGYRLLAPGELEDAPAFEKANSVTIRDMFILTAVLAMLFAGLLPWLPSFGDVYQSMSMVLGALGQFAILSLAPIVAWWLAMSHKKWLRLGDLLFLGTLTFLIASAAYRFSGSSSLIFDLFGVFPPVDRLPAMSFVATYWVACCFRFRGWKFHKPCRPSSLA